MPDFPLLTFIIFTPAAGRAAGRLLTPARRPELARAVGYAATAATAGFAGYLLWHFETGRDGLPVRRGPPVDRRRSASATCVGVDGISLFMVALTALLFPLGLLASADAHASG